MKKTSTLIGAIALAMLNGCVLRSAALATAGPGGTLALHPTFEDRHFCLDGRDGRLYAGDLDCGPLAEGDVVEIEETGKLSVNDKQRARIEAIDTDQPAPADRASPRR